MLDATFDYIWDNIIVVSAKAIFRSIDENDRNKSNFVLHCSQLDHDNVFEIYIDVRNRLKQFYHYGNNNMERKIDIHKVAACFASVLMSYKLFSFEMNSDTVDAIFLSNANLAYSVSLGIVKMDLLYKYQSDASIFNSLIENDLFIPKTTIGHDHYHEGRIKTIALNDVFENDFDILTYSDMLYWIELYNIMILENRNAKEYVELDKAKQEI